MPKWNIDKSIVRLEPDSAPGTSIERVLMDTGVMKTRGLKPTSKQSLEGQGVVWCMGVGFLGQPKAYFYGQTIREAFLRARKAAKKDRLAEHTPWGSQAFKLKKRLKKKDVKKIREGYERSTSKRAT